LLPCFCLSSVRGTTPMVASTPSCIAFYISFCGEVIVAYVLSEATLLVARSAFLDLEDSACLAFRSLSAQAILHVVVPVTFSREPSEPCSPVRRPRLTVNHRNIPARARHPVRTSASPTQRSGVRCPLIARSDCPGIIYILRPTQLKSSKAVYDQGRLVHSGVMNVDGPNCPTSIPIVLGFPQGTEINRTKSSAPRRDSSGPVPRNFSYPLGVYRRLLRASTAEQRPQAQQPYRDEIQNGQPLYLKPHHTLPQQVTIAAQTGYKPSVGGRRHSHDSPAIPTGRLSSPPAGKETGNNSRHRPLKRPPGSLCLCFSPDDLDSAARSLSALGNSLDPKLIEPASQQGPVSSGKPISRPRVLSDCHLVSHLPKHRRPRSHEARERNPLPLLTQGQHGRTRPGERHEPAIA
jgi:hypothetical protein